MSLWSRIVAKSLISVVVGLALALTVFPASASASKISFSHQPFPECSGNGFGVAGSTVSVDPQLGWLEGSLSQFSVLQLRSPVVNWAFGLPPVSVRAELIADGTNQVLHRVSSDNFYFKLADERNGASGAINDPNTYLGRNLSARITYVRDFEYGRCTVTLTSNRIGPVLTSTQYTPGAPQVVRPAGQAYLMPGARAQVNLALNNVLPTENTPEPLLTWRVEYGYADSDRADFATCRAADGGPFTSTRLDGTKAARGEWQPRASFNIDVPANKAGKWLCVRHQVQSLLGRATSPVTYAFIKGNDVAPRVPVITMKNAGDAFEVGKEFILTLEISGQLVPGEQLRDRLFYHNWVVSGDAECNVGLDRPVQWNHLDKMTVIFEVPSIMVGKWFCAKQILQTSSGLKSSPVVYRKVLASSVAASPLPSLRVIPSPLPSLRVIPSPLARPSVSSSSNVVQPTVSATSGPGDKSSASLSESLAQSDNSTTTDKESSLVSSGINVLEKAQDSNSSSLNMLIVILGSVIVIILITLIIIFSKRKQ
jgi:hypothetical protein